MFDHDFHFGFEYLSEEETLEGPLRLTALGVETEWCSDKVTKHNERPIYTYTFLYTIQGSGIVEDEKGIKHVCGKNHAALIFEPSETKRYPEPETKEKWRYCWIMFIVTKQTKKYCNQILEKAGMVFYMPPNSMAITSMVDLITKRRLCLLDSRYLMFAGAYDFLCKLSHEILTERYKFSPMVLEAMKIIEGRFERIDGILEVAEELHMSQNYLTRVFKEECGMTPVKYLLKVRLNYAMELLTSSNETIKEIAKECGFSSESYFVKVFQKKMSISPSDFRRKRKN